MTKPMFAWAGGKQKLLKHYLPYFPDQQITTYSEPFFGGGAMFAYVVERYNPKVAYLNDINGEIIGIYRAVRDHLGDFIKLLQSYENQYLPLCADGRKSFYYQLRDQNKRDYRSWSEVEQAAAQFVLLKTCYRGLWLNDEDLNGRFNTGAGCLEQIRKLYDEELLEYWHNILTKRKVHLMTEDWSRVPICDFTFYDPPYRDSRIDYGYAFRDSEMRKLIRIVEENSNVWLANWDIGDGFFESTRAKVLRLNAKRSIQREAGDHRDEVLLVA